MIRASQGSVRVRDKLGVRGRARVRLTMVIRDFWVRDRVRVMVRGRGMISDTCELCPQGWRSDWVIEM